MSLPANQSEYLLSMRASANRSCRHPSGTIRCMGAAMFRTEEARDYGYLLDLEPDVLPWSCLPFVVVNDGELHVPDFMVRRADGDFLVEVVGPRKDPTSVMAGRGSRAQRILVLGRWQDDLVAKSIRVGNARDLLRYAR